MSDRLVFSTDGLPERDRFAAWREEIIGRNWRLDLITPDRSRFRSSFEVRRLGATDLSYYTTSPVGFGRTKSQLGDGDDSLFIVLLEHGNIYDTQTEDPQKFMAGDGLIGDCAN